MACSDTQEMDDTRGEGEEEREMGMTGLDFDLICSTVALQTHKGKWTRLSTEEDRCSAEEGRGELGAAFRMWEGEVYDCLEDRRIALQSLCCPCYRFGRNMKRAGLGDCFLQGCVYFLLILAVLLSTIAFVVTNQHRYLFIAIGFTFSIGLYLGIFRSQIRKKFNIRDRNSLLNDCIFHLACPCCSLSQESITLEMNNVCDGIWHGPSDTIFVGSYKDGNKLNPPLPVSTAC